MTSKKGFYLPIFITVFILLTIVGISSAQAEDIDFMVDDIYTPTSLVAGQFFTFEARVSNDGLDETTKPIYAFLYIDGKLATWWYWPSGYPAYAYTDIYADDMQLTSGTHSFKLVMDAANAVYESNESNNTRIESFTWAGVPDFTVEDIYPPTSFVAGEVFTFTAKVKNIGWGHTTKRVDADLYVDGEYFCAWYWEGFPALAYGEVSTEMYIPYNGVHTFSLMMDPDNTIAEANEHNNERVESFTWSGAPSAPTGVTAAAGPKSGQVSLSWNPNSESDLAGYYIDRGTSPGNYTVRYDVQDKTWTGATISGLTNNTTYYFAISAYDTVGGEGDFSAEVSAVPQAGPSSPTGVSASAGPRSGQITITWGPNPESNLDGYYIYRGTSPGKYDICYDIDDETWPGAILSGLTSGATYYFVIAAYNKNGIQSEFSQEVSAVPQAGPTPPAGVTAAAGPKSEQVTITWSPNPEPNLDGYKIYRGTSPGKYNVYYDITDETWPGAILSGLTNGTTYYFAMTAYNREDIESDFSQEVSATPKSAPSVPAGVTAAAGPGSEQVTIRWDTNPEADLDGYRIYRGASPGKYNVYYDIEDETWPGAILSGLTNGTTYYFVMTAYNTSGIQSEFSQEVSAAPKPGPGVPTGLRADAGPGSGEIKVRWNSNPESDLNGYRIYRGTSPGKYTVYYDITDENWTGVVLKQLTNNTTYYFVITAYNTNGIQSAFSYEVSAVPKAGPAAPTGLSAVPGPGSQQVTITWNPNTELDLAGYNLYRGISSQAYTSHYEIPKSSKGIVISNLTNNTRYYFALTAYNTANVESGYSVEVTVTPNSAPSRPTGILAVAGPGSGQITVRWNRNPEFNIDGYLLLIGTSPGSYNKQYDITNEDVPEKVFSNLTKGIRYYFVLAAYNNDRIRSDFSNEVSAVPAEGGPAVPTGLNAVAGPGSNQATLSWNANPESNLAYYRIHQGIQPGQYNVRHDRIPKGWNVKTEIFDLTNGMTYYFAVTAVNTSGMESGYSNEANVVPREIGDRELPSVPGNLAIIDPKTGDELQVRWSASTDNAGISHYRLYRLTNNPAVSYTNYDYGFPVATTSTIYLDYGLKKTNTYYYKVLAVDTSDNWSGLSNLASGSPADILAPAAPQGKGFSAGDKIVDLWWTAPAANTDGTRLTDLAGYNIYRGAVSGSYGASPINGSKLINITMYHDTGLTNGQTYYYVIKAVDDAGNQGPPSLEISATPVHATFPPAAPAGVILIGKPAELQILWPPNRESNLAGYNIYRATVSGGYSPTALNSSLITTEFYVDKDIDPAKTYFYVVRAVNNAGQESSNSNEVSGKAGEGALWIVQPTTAVPAVLDFDTQVNPHVVIRYNLDANYLNLYQCGVKIKLEVIDSTTKENKVSHSYKLDPRSSSGDFNPHFSWNGKDMSGNTVLPGEYDVKVSLDYQNSAGQWVCALWSCESRAVRVVKSQGSVAISYPEENSNVSGAMADVEVTYNPVTWIVSEAKLYLSNSSTPAVIHYNPSSPDTFTWDTAQYTDGASVNIQVKASDSKGNTASDSIDVTVYNKALILGISELTNSDSVVASNSVYCQEMNHSTFSQVGAWVTETNILTNAETYTVFYINSHGNVLGETYFIDDFRNRIYSSEVKNNLGKTSEPPYNFVFIDACHSAELNDMAHAFGIFEQTQNRAYLGWVGTTPIWITEQFNNVLWEHLGNGKSIGYAAQKARKATKVENNRIYGDSNMVLH